MRYIGLVMLCMLGLGAGNASFADEGADIIITVAGNGDFGFSGDGGPATQAKLSAAAGVAVDAGGNIYIADTGNHRIRRVAPDGIITTFAGSNYYGFAGDGGPATKAVLYSPSDVTVDSVGNVYIADTENHRIRRVAPDGIISTFAGRWNEFSGDGGPATEAGLDTPSGIAVDRSGNVFIADTGNNRIRRITPDGIITTLSGGERQGLSGDGGPATEAALNGPEGVTVDAVGNVYIADKDNHRIRRVGTDGIITTFAGTGTKRGFSGDGGPATDAHLASPAGVAMDADGNLYIADAGNLRIRRVAPDGIITTVVGSGNWRIFGEGGPASQAGMLYPGDVAVDAGGSIYIADTNFWRIRRVGIGEPVIRLSRTHLFFSSEKAAITLPEPITITNPSRTPLTVSEIKIEGDGAEHFSVSATSLTVGQADSQTVTVTFAPTSAGEKFASLVIAHNAFRGPAPVDLRGRAAPEGAPIITTIAGIGTKGSSGDLEQATEARLDFPESVDMDAAGNVYIADTGNDRIRRVALDGTISTFAGGRKVPESLGDGGPAFRSDLNNPRGVCTDAGGNVYIADTYHHRIRRVGTDGIITTFAGMGGEGHFSGDGWPATQAELDRPSDVAADAVGNIYIADKDNHRIRRVGTDGIITTFAGTGAERGFSGDNGPATLARLNSPTGVAVDKSGNVFIADTGNHRVRRVTVDGLIATIAGIGDTESAGGGFSGDGAPAIQAKLKSPNGVAVDAAGNVYIADSGNHRIRQVTADGIITTLAGSGTVGWEEQGFSVDGGPAVFAELKSPWAVAVAVDGNVYIADRSDHRVRRVEGIGQAEEPVVPTDPVAASDVDGDGSVGFSDFLSFAQGFGKSLEQAGFNARLDFDGDGSVGFSDFLFFARNYGKRVGG